MQLGALESIAEVGVAVAGFATLAGVIRRDRLDTQELFGVVQCSLVSVVFALVPLALPGPGHGLRPLAAVFLIVWSAMWLHASIAVRKLMTDPSIDTNAYMAVLVYAVNIGGSALALAVAAGLGDPAVLYQLAALCPVSTAIFLLWDVVRRYLQGRQGPPAA